MAYQAVAYRCGGVSLRWRFAAAAGATNKEQVAVLECVAVPHAWSTAATLFARERCDLWANVAYARRPLVELKNGWRIWLSSVLQDASFDFCNPFCGAPWGESGSELIQLNAKY